ncbi:hypothetical protein [Candidatus Odyssella thessalonicensis]|uniref:hypothetical protein n=1 Tax=Candidatus Odyssella thessalonicensis TaxID=84647 RepID=UPI000225AC89|nr:hypothetical protein [Candidatus Odyssella thessalonicensis]
MNILLTFYALCLALLPSVEAAEESVMYCEVYQTYSERKAFKKVIENPESLKNLKLKIYQDEETNQEVEFSSEAALYKYLGSKVNKKADFPQDAATILQIIKGLSPASGNGQYNHLCSTLYLIYQECTGNTRRTRISESPLYAKWKEGKLKFDDEGNLVQAKKVVFYTKINSQISNTDRIAYFTRHRSVLYGEPDIFPITCTGEKSDVTGKCWVCKNGDTDHTKNCGHTEPSALYHIKDAFFDKLVPQPEENESEDEGENGSKTEIKVLSCGIRFFSWYQPCSHCIKDLIKQKGEITVKGTTIPKNIIFYFHNTYVLGKVKINKKEYNLSSYATNYLYEGYLRDDNIYNSPASEEDTDDHPKTVLKIIELKKIINLRKTLPIILIKSSFLEDNVEKFKIVVS